MELAESFDRSVMKSFGRRTANEFLTAENERETLV